MYPAGFQYERAGTVEEAVDFLIEYAGSETELLAGGHSLLPTMKSGLASPSVLIDIGRIDGLRGIERDDDTTTIGALTSYADIEEANDLWDDCPVVAEAASEIGDVQVRNMGTIGGNIAHADPGSDMPASILAADATLHIYGQDGQREIPAEDFFQEMFTTDLGEAEILTGVEVPNCDANTTSAYVKRSSPSSGFALVGVATLLQTDGDSIQSARVATTGATDYAVRLAPVEDALTGATLSPETLTAAAERATEDLGGATLMSDNQASSKFRGQLLIQYTNRALTQAAKQAKSNGTRKTDDPVR